MLATRLHHLASTHATAPQQASRWGAWNEHLAEGFVQTHAPPGFEPQGSRRAPRYMSKLAAIWGKAHPAHGCSSTLFHGDMRGDNLFFAKEGTDWSPRQGPD